MTSGVLTHAMTRNVPPHTTVFDVDVFETAGRVM